MEGTYWFGVWPDPASGSHFAARSFGSNQAGTIYQSQEFITPTWTGIPPAPARTGVVAGETAAHLAADLRTPRTMNSTSPGAIIPRSSRATAAITRGSSRRLRLIRNSR